MADSRDARRAASAGLRYWIVLLPFGAFLVLGCGGGPDAIAPPDWDPVGMADAAMKLNDKDGDGLLDAQELAAAPGLQAAAEASGGSADLNDDGNLSRDEIRDRIAFYEERRVGLQTEGFAVYLDKRPLGGAQVEVVPEPFLEGVLKVARATTREADGWAIPAVEGEDVPGMQPGMYRVKITHPSQQIPAKYNEQTTLGIEVSLPREGYGTGVKRVFELTTN